MDYPGLGPEVTPLAYWSSSTSFQNRPLCHPLTGQHHLLKTVKPMACALSRKCWKNRALQETLLKLFCLAGEMAQNNTRIHTSKDGCNIALNGWKPALVHLKMNWLTVSLDFTKRAKESWIQCFEHVAQCCLYTVLKWRLFSGQPCSCLKMFKGHV